MKKLLSSLLLISSLLAVEVTFTVVDNSWSNTNIMYKGTAKCTAATNTITTTQNHTKQHANIHGRSVRNGGEYTLGASCT